MSIVFQIFNVHRKSGSSTECHQLAKCSEQTNSRLKKQPFVARKCPHSLYYSSSKNQVVVAPVVDEHDGKTVHLYQSPNKYDLNSNCPDMTTEQKVMNRRAITVAESQNTSNLKSSSVHKYPCSSSILKIVQAIKEFGTGDKVAPCSHPQMKRTMQRQAPVLSVSYSNPTLMGDNETKDDGRVNENSLIGAKNKETMETTMDEDTNSNINVRNAAQNVESMLVNSVNNTNSEVEDFQTGEKISHDSGNSCSTMYPDNDKIQQTNHRLEGEGGALLQRNACPVIRNVLNGKQKTGSVYSKRLPYTADASFTEKSGYNEVLYEHPAKGKSNSDKGCYENSTTGKLSDGKDCFEDENNEGDYDLYRCMEDDTRTLDETNYIYIMLSDSEEFDESNYYNGFEAYLNSKTNREKGSDTKSNFSGAVIEKDLVSAEHNSSVTDSMIKQAVPSSLGKQKRRKRKGGDIRRNIFSHDLCMGMLTDVEKGNVFREGTFAGSALRWSNRLACKERLNYAVMEDTDEIGMDGEELRNAVCILENNNADIFENVGCLGSALPDSSKCSMNEVEGLSVVSRSPWKSVMPTATQFRNDQESCIIGMSAKEIGQDQTKCDLDESKKLNQKYGSLFSLQGKTRLLKNLKSKRKMFGKIRKRAKKHSCRYCSMRYTKPYLAMHQKNHCVSAIQYKAAADQPCRQMHPCKYCGRCYPKPYLYNHQREHMRKQEMGLKDNFLTRSLKHKKSEIVKTRRGSRTKLERNLIKSENESMSSTIYAGRSKKYQCPECNYQTDWSERWLCHQLVHKQSHTITCDHCSIVFTSMKALKIWHTKNGIVHITEEPGHCNDIPASHEMKEGSDLHGEGDVENISPPADLEKNESKGINKPGEINANEVVERGSVGNSESCSLSAIEQLSENVDLLPAQKHPEAENSENSLELDFDNSHHKDGEETDGKAIDDMTNAENNDWDGKKDSNSSRRDDEKSERCGKDNASQMKWERILTGSGNGSMSSPIYAGRSKKYQCPECNYQTDWSERWLCHQLVHKQSHTITCDHCSIVFTSMKGLKIWHTKNGIVHITEEPGHCNDVPASHEMKERRDLQGENLEENNFSLTDLENLASQGMNKTREINAKEVVDKDNFGNSESCSLSATEQLPEHVNLLQAQKHPEAENSANSLELDFHKDKHKDVDIDSTDDSTEHFTPQDVDLDKTDSEVVDGGEETSGKAKDEKRNTNNDGDGKEDDKSSRRDGYEKSNRTRKDNADGGDERDKDEDSETDENNNEERGAESLQCIICEAKFTQKSSLLRHMTKIHRLVNLCQICYFKHSEVNRFSNPVSLRNHKLRQHPDDMVKCVCGTMLIDQAMLTSHLKKFKCNANQGTDHAVSDMVKCKCGKRFGNQQLLLNHKNKCRKRRTIEDIVENLRGDQIKLEPKHSRRSASLNTDETYQDVKIRYDQHVQDQPSCSSSSYEMASSSSASAGCKRESGVSEHQTVYNNGSASNSGFANVGTKDLNNNDIDTENGTDAEEQENKKGKGKLVSKKGKAPTKKKRKTKKPDAEGRYPCKTCGQRFKRPYLYVHQKQVHQRKQWVLVPARQKIVKRFQCGWCKYKSVSWGGVLTHHYGTHQEHELNIMDLP